MHYGKCCQLTCLFILKLGHSDFTVCPMESVTMAGNNTTEKK